MLEKNKVQRLAQYPMFAALNAEGLELIERTCDLVPYGAGRMVIREGDAPKAFCLMSGACRVFHRSGSKEVLVKMFGAPAVGGEMEVLTHRNYLVNMRTLVASEIVFFRPDVFTWLVNKSPGFAAGLCLDLSARLFIATSNERALAFADVDKRLADLLLDYAHIFGAEELGGVRINYALSQSNLSRDLAVDRKSIVRAFQRLKKRNVVVKESARYVIKNVEALKQASTYGLGLLYRATDPVNLDKEPRSL